MFKSSCAGAGNGDPIPRGDMKLVKQKTSRTLPAGLIGYITITLFSLVCTAAPLQGSPSPAGGASSSPSACTACHMKIVAQYEQSHHARSFSNPLVRAQYFRDLLPRVEKEPGLYTDDATGCIVCHSPMDFLERHGRIVTEDTGASAPSGIPCILCHTIKGYNGTLPGNGNYLSTHQSEPVLGPYKEKSGGHHV